MSTKYDDKLYMVPFKAVDLIVPKLPLTVLPGRAAVLSHPINQGRDVLTVDSEMYHPGVCLVAQSGIGYVEPGQVWIVAPDRGAYYPDLSPDGREVRLLCANQKAVAVRSNSGTNRPWDVFLAQYGEGERIAPGPGWWLVEVHKKESHVAVPHPEETGTCTVLSGTSVERDGKWVERDMAGTETFCAGLSGYRFCGPGWDKDWRLVRAPVPVAWLQAVSKARHMRAA